MGNSLEIRAMSNFDITLLGFFPLLAPGRLRGNSHGIPLARVVFKAR
jgi:hypothetical protein